MIINIIIEHNLPASKQLMLDSMYVHTSDGKELFLDWDESSWDYKDNISEGRCKGVCIKDEYGNGRLNELEGLKNIDLNLCPDPDYAEDGVCEINARVKSILFTDGNSELRYDYPETI